MKNPFNQTRDPETGSMAFGTDSRPNGPYDVTLPDPDRPPVDLSDFTKLIQKENQTNGN
jgi:hypothetical protein